MAESFKYEGTISHGTLKLEDLISAFGPVLRDLAPAKWASLVVHQSSDLQEFVIKLIDTLDDLAPEGYYFGTIEGDGSDFGFWKEEEGDS